MSTKVFAILAIAVSMCVSAGPAAADDDTSSLPEWSVGAPAACGDTTVASMVAAECLQTETTDEVTVVRSMSARTPTPAPAPADEDAPPANCRYHANVIFYAASDWVRVGEILKADASPCAQYWIHIPTLAANKLACRINQAHQIRKHGIRFHAMCEAHLNGAAAWIAQSPSTRTWYQAGVNVRLQMASVGFDVTKGDTWSINELTSAMRRGDGNARQNVLDYMRGLYEGGPEPDVQGNAFVIGLAQLTVPTTVYKENLKKWFRDSTFWAEASKYVKFWGQEVYGDIRHTLVPGEPRMRRAEALNDYLQQVGMLAQAGPDEEIAKAKSYLAGAHYPLANAAWGWPSAFGFTAVALDTMKQYISLQEHAMRHYLGANPHRSSPTLGYAWSPRNQFGLPAPQFRAQWEELLVRLASSISESLGNGGGSQMGACGQPGEHVWCEGDYEGAFFNQEWSLLRSWD